MSDAADQPQQAGQPVAVLVLAECAKHHRGNWNMDLLQSHAHNEGLMLEAHAAVLELPEEMYAIGREVLQGMHEPMATLSLAIRTSRRGSGGRVSEPNPLDDPCMDIRQAQRIINKRRTAALSKFRSKVANLAEAAIRAGLMPEEPQEDDLADDPADSDSTPAAAAAAAAAAGLGMFAGSGFGGSSSSPCGSESGACLPRMSLRSSSRPAAAPGAADADALMDLDAVPDDTDAAGAGDQHKKRPQCAQQLMLPSRAQQARSCVKRHKSQQLLGSSASRLVANGRSASLNAIRSSSAGSPAPMPGSAGFTDVYTQAALADAAAAAAEAAVQGQQQQLSLQGGVAVAPNHLAAGGAGRMVFGAPAQQQQQQGTNGTALAECWSLDEFDIPGSPTLSGLLLAGGHAESSGAGSGWDWPQAPSNAGQQNAGHNQMPAQNMPAAPPGAAAAAGAGAVAGMAAAPPAGSSAAAAALLQAVQQQHAAWQRDDAASAFAQQQGLGASAPAAAASAAAAAEWPAGGAQHAGLLMPMASCQSIGSAQQGAQVSTARAGPPPADMCGGVHAPAAAAGFSPAGDTYGSASYMPARVPSPAGDVYGSVLGMGLPAGQFQPAGRACMAGNSVSNSPAAVVTGYAGHGQGSRGARSYSSGPVAGAGTAPGRPNPFQAAQEAALRAASASAGRVAQNRPEPRGPGAATGLLEFVSGVIASSNGNIVAGANSILPVLAAAATAGYQIRPALKQLQIALLEAHLQRQRTQLVDMLDGAYAALGQAAPVDSSDIASTLSDITQLDSMQSGMSHSMGGAAQDGAGPYFAGADSACTGPFRTDLGQTLGSGLLGGGHAPCAGSPPPPANPPPMAGAGRVGPGFGDQGQAQLGGRVPGMQVQQGVGQLMLPQQQQQQGGAIRFNWNDDVTRRF